MFCKALVLISHIHMPRIFSILKLRMTNVHLRIFGTNRAWLVYCACVNTEFLYWREEVQACTLCKDGGLNNLRGGCVCQGQKAPFAALIVFKIDHNNFGSYPATHRSLQVSFADHTR